MQLHPFPEPDAPELEHYMLYSRGEIVAILQRIGRERTLVTIYTGDGEFSVSMILNVDPDFDEATFDMPVNPEAQARVLAASDLVFVIFFENVKVQFRAQIAQATTFEGRAAFRVRLPTQMLRLQRREYFRVRTPLMGQASCLVPQESGASKYESLQVLNISIGGLAVLSYPHNFDLPLGETIRNCFLDLPGIGPVNVAFRVVNVYDSEDDAQGRRCGCQFVDLAPQARMMLQRYVNRVEAEQRKALGNTRSG
ncbi:putative Flagellar brake protein YcgR [Burkholderiales bacterium]|jgi:c-di-GMP-binding flagellar brake protein YcgR|nr:putative Flagellar brake protein YcgR [Burkholderiales bacterium]